MRVPVPAIAKVPCRCGKIRHHRNREAGIARQCLLKTQICGDTLYIAAMELLQCAGAAIPAVNARIAIAYAMNVEVERHKISSPAIRGVFAAKISAPVRSPIPGGEVQNLFQLAAPHRRSARIEIERGTPLPCHAS